MFFRQWWKDPRLVLGGNTSYTFYVDPSPWLWTPDTYFTNGKDEKHFKFLMPNARMKLQADGNIYFSQP